MPGKELYPKYVRDFFGSQSKVYTQESEVQQQESELEPVAAAQEAHQIIEGFAQGLQSTPQFIEALAKHYFDPIGSTITYPVGETLYYSVQFKKEYSALPTRFRGFESNPLIFLSIKMDLAR